MKTIIITFRIVLIINKVMIIIIIITLVITIIIFLIKFLIQTINITLDLLLHHHALYIQQCDGLMIELSDYIINNIISIQQLCILADLRCTSSSTTRSE
eukprot:UN09939